VGQSCTRPAIATTHTGSLPRPPELLEVLRRDPSGAGLEPLAPAAVAEIVRRQREVGLAVVNDGE
jgi:5-methyltetrahydropteroyltriglutamate--homocysteine methyltransferase